LYRTRRTIWFFSLKKVASHIIVAIAELGAQGNYREKRKNSQHAFHLTSPNEKDN